MHKDIERILIDSVSLQKSIKELADEVSADYAGRVPVIVGVLKGCVVFMADFIKYLSIDCHIDFMMVSSYSGTRSTGVVRTLLDLKENIEGKDVLIVEDIVDSGLTISYLLKVFKTRSPRSLEICTLFNKPKAHKVHFPIKYTGFNIGNEFIVGYGLDYNELYRNLPYIGVLKSAAKTSSGVDK